MPENFDTICFGALDEKVVIRPPGPDPRSLSTNRGEEGPKKPISVDKAPGRNDPCPCGSGKKYKKCHGRGV